MAGRTGSRLGSNCPPNRTCPKKYRFGLSFCLLILGICLPGCSSLFGDTNEATQLRFIGKTCPQFANPFRISVLNVGQGDAILVTCPDKVTNILIDGGESNEGYPNGESLFLDSLIDKLGDDRKLEYAINTHPHSDHIFGLYRLLSDKSLNITLDHYLDSGTDNPESYIEEQIRSLVVKNGGKYSVLNDSFSPGMHFCKSIDDDVRFELIQLTELEKSQLHCPNNLNDCSLVFKISYQGITFLLLADTTLAWENVTLPRLRKNLESTIMKVGHHASSSTSKQLLDSVSPQFVVLSTGSPNIGTTSYYAFPENSVINRIQHYLNSTFRVKGIPKNKIQSCLKESSACNWLEHYTHPYLLSTTVLGTINFLVENGHLCVETERNNSQLYFRLNEVLRDK